MAENPNQNSLKRIITTVAIIIGVGLIGIAILKISIHHDKYDLYDPSKLAPGDIIDTISVPAEIDSLLEKTQSKMFDLIYQEKVEKGLIILFKDEFGFRHAFFSNKMEVWNISGNTELSPKEGFTWTMTNDPNIPILTFAGLITDKDIQTVIVKQKSSTSQAKIITTTQGRFWFTHFDYLEGTSGQSDPLKLKLYQVMARLFGKKVYMMERIIEEELKRIEDLRFKTVSLTKNEALEKDIRAYIHFYNYERLQARLDGLRPMEFRTKAA
ncbi:Integrase core domain-containing protein [Paenibacillus sp. UNC496MF]|uniref:IS3 family transposase n=1 Tax=Paenibacillus sp. UNC496MF TaxID=1502753 RepID=UPI0008DFFEA9|nr:IS3 family transposase [Paenibacillus sp. UNC496MF]SFJ59912.1 Integrase core domain-containing protein [Paenibacillus sp. UNC496MF]